MAVQPVGMLAAAREAPLIWAPAPLPRGWGVERAAHKILVFSALGCEHDAFDALELLQGVSVSAHIRNGIKAHSMRIETGPKLRAAIFTTVSMLSLGATLSYAVAQAPEDRPSTQMQRDGGHSTAATDRRSYTGRYHRFAPGTGRSVSVGRRRARIEPNDQ